MLTDAVATPLHGLKRVARLQPGETLVVLGVGGLGSNAVQLGKAMGARVIAVTRSAAKLRLARELGADETVAADDGDPVAAVKALTGGHGPDVVIQCVGSAAVDEQAIAMGGPGGRVVLIGASAGPRSGRAPSTSSGGSWRSSGRAASSPTTSATRSTCTSTGRWSSDHLVERVRPLEEANEALDDLKAGRVFRSVLAPT